jgi:hypothetical protein
MLQLAAPVAKAVTVDRSRARELEEAITVVPRAEAAAQAVRVAKEVLSHQGTQQRIRPVLMFLTRTSYVCIN